MSTLKPIMPEHILNIDTSFVSDHRKTVDEIYNETTTEIGRRISLFKKIYKDETLSFKRKNIGWHARFSDQVDFWAIKNEKEETVEDNFDKNQLTNELINDKITFIKDMINIQLVDDTYASTKLSNGDSAKLDSDVNSACSFQANVIRNGIFAWVLGRLGEDMQYEFEALAEYRDIVDAAFDITFKVFDIAKYVSEDIIKGIIMQKEKVVKLTIVQLDDGTTTIMEDAEATGMNKLSDVNLTWGEYYYLMDRKAFLEYCSDPKNAENSKDNKVTFKNFKKVLEEDNSELIKTLKNYNGIEVLSEKVRKKGIINYPGNSASMGSQYDFGYDMTHTLTYPTRIFAIGANGEETNISNDNVSAVKKFRIYFRISTELRPIRIDVHVPSTAPEGTKIRYLATSLLPICDKIMESVTSYSKTRGVVKTILDGINHGAELWQAISIYNTERLEFGFHDLQRKFNHAADCVNTVPSILEHSLAYIRSGHYFDRGMDLRNISPTAAIKLSGTSTSNLVELSWSVFSGAAKYYVFKDGKADLPITADSSDTTTVDETISGLTASTSYSFYVNAVNDSGTVLAQSQTIMVTTTP